MSEPYFAKIFFTPSKPSAYLTSFSISASLSAFSKSVLLFNCFPLILAVTYFCCTSSSARVIKSFTASHCDIEVSPIQGLILSTLLSPSAAISTKALKSPVIRVLLSELSSDEATYAIYGFKASDEESLPYKPRSKPRERPFCPINSLNAA